MIPWWYAPMLNHPTSSPMMNRMFGCRPPAGFAAAAGCCAVGVLCAGAAGLAAGGFCAGAGAGAGFGAGVCDDAQDEAAIEARMTSDRLANRFVIMGMHQRG